MPASGFGICESGSILSRCRWLVDALLPEFDHEMTTTRKLLERVPDDGSTGSRTRSRCRSASWPRTSPTIPMWGRDHADPVRVGSSPGFRRGAMAASRAELLALFDRNVADGTCRR